jgi:hypothetical protein
MTGRIEIKNNIYQPFYSWPKYFNPVEIWEDVVKPVDPFSSTMIPFFTLFIPSDVQGNSITCPFSHLCCNTKKNSLFCGCSNFYLLTVNSKLS